MKFMYDVPFYISLIVTLVAYLLDLYQNIFKKFCKKSADGKITDSLTMLVKIDFQLFSSHFGFIIKIVLTKKAKLFLQLHLLLLSMFVIDEDKSSNHGPILINKFYIILICNMA